MDGEIRLKNNQNHIPYFSSKPELSVYNLSILWGGRAIIPMQLRRNVLTLKKLVGEAGVAVRGKFEPTLRFFQKCFF